jgi:hypothetical protein
MSKPRDPSSAELSSAVALAKRLMIGAVLLLLAGASARADDVARDAMAAKAARLIAAYPDHLERLDGNMLVWKDGERMPFEDGVAGKSADALLDNPDIEDQFTYAYPLADQPVTPPPPNFDPGRIRNQAFFTKMYGDCKKGLGDKLVTIDWLPKKKGGRLQTTTVNGIDKKLKAISDELDALPGKYDAFLVPSAGSYVCRAIAATNRRSGHAYGFAVDINATHADYWLWNKSSSKDKAAPYHNRVPIEIVRIFEKHGFIWGGRWYHFDTMHFEYRPELIGAAP